MICRWLRIAAVIFILITAVSCSLKSDDTAFLSELDVIDALILHGDVDSAVKRLHKAESKALNVYLEYCEIFHVLIIWLLLLLQQFKKRKWLHIPFSLF